MYVLFFQAEDGIRDLVRSRGLGDVYKRQGFAGVWELLAVGPFEKGNKKYYQALEKLTGITKETYNDKIWELINNEK